MFARLAVAVEAEDFRKSELLEYVDEMFRLHRLHRECSLKESNFLVHSCLSINSKNFKFLKALNSNGASVSLQLTMCNERFAALIAYCANDRIRLGCSGM